jgi:hypothetical protein
VTHIERKLGLTLLTGVIVAIALTLAISGTVLGVLALTHVTKDEHKTCIVQNRGLKAQAHLTGIMSDIATLLETPTNAPIPPRIRHPLEDLKAQLPAYTTLEHKQPKGRHC